MNMPRLFFVVFIFLLPFGVCAQDTLKSPNVEAILYAGKGKRLPLVVGLGGSEGGNAWASDRWKDTRNKILDKGYAFLALGYFGCRGTPKLLDRIAIEDVHNAILAATHHKKVDGNNIYAKTIRPALHHDFVPDVIADAGACTAIFKQ